MNGATSLSSSQMQFHSSTVAVHSSLRPTSARGAASERSHASRSTVPPTPPTRDRSRLEPYADRNGSRCALQEFRVIVIGASTTFFNHLLCRSKNFILTLSSSSVSAILSSTQIEKGGCYGSWLMEEVDKACPIIRIGVSW